VKVVNMWMILSGESVIVCCGCGDDDDDDSDLLSLSPSSGMLMSLRRSCGRKGERHSSSVFVIFVYIFI
jgi:hypothetical protein